MAGEHIEEHGGRRHRPRHGDAVGGSESSGRLEPEDEQQAADHESAVDRRHVDLPDSEPRGVDNREARTVAELHALLREGKGAGNESLRRHDRRERRHRHDGIQEDIRRQPVERVLDGAGQAQKQRALAEVVQQQCRQDHTEPHESDGPASEVAHVRVEGLGARDGQHHRSQDDEAPQAMRQKESDGVPRTEREEDVGPTDDLHQPEGGDGDEPHDHDGTEDAAHARRAVLLKAEEQDQDHECHRNHEVGEGGRRHLDPLDRAQDRDGRRDHPIAVEERRAEQSQANERGADGALALQPADAQDQGEQREDAAFTVVVESHHEDDVFDAHDQEQ